jgi:pyruvate kinase
VRQMAAIAIATEENIYPFAQPVWGHVSKERDVFTHVIASMAGHASREIDPRAVVVFTRTGRTARILSFERPHPKIVAFTPDRSAYRRLQLHWGVFPRLLGEIGSAADLHREGEKLVVEGGFARPGDTVLFISGTSLSEGTTNSVRIVRIGD